MTYGMNERWIERWTVWQRLSYGLIALLIVSVVYALTAYTLYALFDPNTNNPDGSPVFAVLLTFPLFLFIGGWSAQCLHQCLGKARTCREGHAPLA
jgi:hypothetical protein